MLRLIHYYKYEACDACCRMGLTFSTAPIFSGHVFKDATDCRRREVADRLKGKEPSVGRWMADLDICMIVL